MLVCPAKVKATSTTIPVYGWNPSNVILLDQKTD
jgi:hypothetical protein